jgi:hypothetical protein
MATTVGSAAVLQMAASASEAAKKRFRQATTDEAVGCRAGPGCRAWRRRRAPLP